MHERDAPRRRTLLGGLAGLAGGSLLGCGGTAARVRSGLAGPDAPPDPTGTSARPVDGVAARVAEALAGIEASLGGRLGVAAIDAVSGTVVAEHRAGERFAMCSTFKLPLAACVLQRVDRGELALDAPVGYGAADLLDHAPVARAHVSEGSLSIEALCAAAVEVSDNTAANLLLAQVGGPAGLTTFFRAVGDRVSRLDRVEPGLNTNVPGDPRDTTSPRAMAETFGAIALGDAVLGTDSRERLARWMIATRTGLARLRGGLPGGWLAGDKTGTGARGAANDVAVVWPRHRAPFVIACYVDAPDATPDARDAAHVEVARAVAEAVGARDRLRTRARG